MPVPIAELRHVAAVRAKVGMAEIKTLNDMMSLAALAAAGEGAVNEPAADPAFVERPLPGNTGNAVFGSDIVAEALRAVGVPYIALNPGASYRGLHDILVNHLGNEAPQMLLCLHEENAVAIAHGYAKVTGRAMAAALHSNVGLMHATMAIFNAWCDRMPVLAASARPARSMPRSAAPGSTGSTPPATRARSSAPTPSGTTSPPRRAAREALMRALVLAQPRRWARSTSTSTPRCRRRSSPSRRPAGCRALHAAGRLRARARARSQRPPLCCGRAENP